MYAMTHWTPIATGETAQNIRKKIEEIGRQSHQSLANPSLLTGKAGRLIMYAYLHKTWARAEDMLRFEEIYESIEADIESKVLAPYLANGVAGIGWALQHLDLLGAEEEETHEAFLEEIDQYLWQALELYEEQATPGDFDLLYGYLGYGVYFLERNHAPMQEAALEKIVALIEYHAEEKADGLFWYSNREGQDPALKVVNLGMAHGVSGVISFLARVHQLGLWPERTRSLLQKSFDYLQQYNRWGPTRLTYFPSEIVEFTPEAKNNSESGLGWCHGDLGISLGIFRLGKALAAPAIIEQSVAMMEQVSLRAYQQAGLQESGICHGTISVAHIFNRFYQQTGKEVFKKTALRYVEYLLSEEIKMDPTDASFLNGTSGVALALLSFVEPVMPAWDRMLMMDL